MRKDIAGVDGVITLPANHAICAVAGQDRVVVILAGIAVAADDFTQFAKLCRANRAGTQEGQDTAVTDNRVGVKAAHVGIACAVDHIAARTAKNDVFAAAGQDHVVATDAIGNRFECVDLIGLTDNLQARDNRIAITLVRRDRDFDCDRATGQAGRGDIVTQTRRIQILRGYTDQGAVKVDVIRIADEIGL